MARQILETNSYTDRLLKLVPAEWVSSYIAIKGILDSNLNAGNEVYFAVIVVQLVVLPVYLRYALRITNKAQIFVTTVSFLVWVFSVGGAHFGQLGWYESYYGSITLILWTSTIPIWKCAGSPDSRTSTMHGRESGGATK